MNFIIFTKIFNILIIFNLLIIIIEKVEAFEEIKNEEDFNKASNILGRFFSLEGFSINTTDRNIVNRYYKEVIEKMEESVNNFHDTLKVYNLNSQVNLLIYKLETVNLPSSESCKPFEPMDEALFQAIDLMLPDSYSEQVYRLAKNDLRKFYLEQPELAKELLSRIVAELNDVNLHTEDLAKYMKNFYYRWIPLGRLDKFIKENAKDG